MKKLLIKYGSIGILAFVLTGSSLAQNTKPAVEPSRTPAPAKGQTSAPTAIPLPTPTPVLQTLAELQSRIQSRLAAPEVRRGTVGVKIVSLNSGKVVFEQNAEKYVMPASNMKNFTIAAAMERLTPDFRFVTSVRSAAGPDMGGVLHGEMRIVGSGDVSISTAFDPLFPKVNNPYFGIDKLVDAIAVAGVKRVEGDLVGDESFFSGDALPGTWEWDDLQTYYGTEVSALPINDNSIDISVRPGTSGFPCSIGVLPANSVVRIVNRCVTRPGPRDLSVVKLLNQNVVEVTGTMPPGDNEFKDAYAVTHPSELFLDLLRQRLLAKGIAVTGRNRTINIKSAAACPTCPPPADVEIAKLESPPLGVIAAKTMKPSQNMYTETILRTLGEKAGRMNGELGESMRLGLGVVKKFLISIGIPADGIVQHDGSGLSRHDLITPAAVVQLYTYMAKQSRYAQAWRDSLSIAGVDGTLRNRFKGTIGAGNLRGKTGTIDQVSALSGYFTTAGGEPIAFSIVVNGVPEGITRTQLIDSVILNVLNFNGKMD
ncbi:MAG: D-alanyl-D-alanine carboxypeptidase/D-alanyl-D-alanine endopeptidase [Pyrinomonadaceae bacterium]